MSSIIFVGILGLIYGIVSAMLDWPIWGIFVFLAVITCIMCVQVFYTLYKSQNLTKIRKFIIKFKKDPVYAYMLLHEQNAPANEKIDMLERVLTKYKQPKYQAIYGVHLALTKQDFDEAKYFVKPILGTELGDYTNDIIDILSGNHSTPKREYTKQWMNDSVIAHEAFIQGDIHKFDEYVQKSLANTGGVQYFGNYYSFQQMRAKIA